MDLQNVVVYALAAQRDCGCQYRCHEVVSPALNQPGTEIISPTWVKVAAPQKSRLGLTLFANSITLTPGTVSVDSGDGYIWVHALSKDGAESLLGDDGGEMGRMASKMEAE